MVLANRNILIISPEPWDHIFVSKHHYAVHLAERGNNVYFLNPPSGRLARHTTAVKRLEIVNYTGFIKGLRFLPILLQKYLMRKQAVRIQQLIGMKFDVVWSFDTSVFYHLDAFPDAVLKILHIVDLNQDFQTASAARTASICFCTSDLIRERLSRFNSKVVKINHGFNHSGDAVSIQLPGTSRVKAVYAGNLAMPFIDWALLENVMRNNSPVDFIFVGPNRDDYTADEKNNDAKRRSSTLPNAFFIGQVASSDLMSYYSTADILIIAYQEKFHRDQANPHKMMEYLGSGRVVVATFTAEFVPLSKTDLVAMSKENVEYFQRFKEVVTDLHFWNSPEKQVKRREFAMTNTYTRQIERIENHIAARFPAP